MTIVSVNPEATIGGHVNLVFINKAILDPNLCAIMDKKSSWFRTEIYLAKVIFFCEDIIRMRISI